MSLTPTTAWRKAAAAGKVEPVLLFEFKPTVLYAEKNFRGDWAAGEEVSNLDVDHPTDELRLAISSEAVIIEQQEKQQAERRFYAAGRYRFLGYEREPKPGYLMTAAQVVQFSRAFKLQKLYIGLENRENTYKGNSKIFLLTNFQHPNRALHAHWYGGSRERVDSPSELERLFTGADKIDEIVIDHSLDGESVEDGGPVIETDSAGQNWRVFDFSKKNVWMPGGYTPCAIVISVDSLYNIFFLRLKVGEARGMHGNGNFYLFNAEDSKFIEPDQSMAFKFEAQGYEATGSGIWEFDLGDPAGYRGELELRYVEPSGTKVVFKMRESGSQYLLKFLAWKTARDGFRITQRYVQVKPVFESDSTRLETPRVFSMRAVFYDSHKFVLASSRLFGYPNVVKEAPDYSTDGDPLAGKASFTDISQIEMLDPGGMISGLFSRYEMKNDEVVVMLGFAGAGLAESDFLAFRTLWIEDWEVADGMVTVHCYDQQVRFREAEAPTPDDPPDQTEEIHYDRMIPEAIKRDLLQRARIRKSKINNGNFTALASAFVWQLTYVIEKPKSLQAVDQALNQHIGGFQVIDEQGKWRCAYTDMNASPDPSTEYLTGDDLVLRSEAFHPGRKHLKNIVTVLYGGTGSDDKGYRGIVIDYDEASEKANKEHAADKLHSEFIPAASTDVAIAVARRRLNVQKNGVRSVEWSTKLKFAYLQIGDHIHIDSTLYSRPGVSSPNPLLVMITRKQINRNLARIHWAGIVLLDNEESEESAPTVNPPQNVAITPGGDGTVSWSWDKSTDDTGAEGQKYELFQRLAHLEAWGPKKITANADGSADYSQPDSDFTELVAYDFGVRFVDSSGRVSAIVAVEDKLLTDSALAPPDAGDWEALPADGAVLIFVNSDVSGAHHYNVYARPNMNDGWQLTGAIPAPGADNEPFSFVPSNPYECAGRIYAFRLCTVNRWGAEGNPSDVKTMGYSPLQKAKKILSAPTLVSAGGYPQISRTAVGPYQKFSIRLKIEPYADEEDLAGYYEVWQRNDEGSGQVSWSGWQKLPDCLIKQSEFGSPACGIIYYDTKDVQLKPGYYYQFKTRAVGRNNQPGTFSDIQTIQLTDDTTGPDQPTIVVTSLPLGLLINISEPAQDGGACLDFAYFKVEGKEAAGSWGTLDPEYRSTVYIHDLANASMSESWQFRITAYDHSGNASTVSAESSAKSPQKASGDSILVNAITTGHCNFTVVGTGNVVGTINASSEGIKISAGKIQISGSCEFSSGYDPTSKVAALGGAYNSAASGARVRIFPDANTGILAIDNAANEVFKVLVGGTNVGDVIIGNPAGQYVKWDKSAGTLLIEGRMKTAETGIRLEIGHYGSADAVVTYGPTGGARAILDRAGLSVSAGAFVSAATAISSSIGFNVLGHQVVGARQAAVGDASNFVEVQAVAGDDTINMSDLNTKLGILHDRCEILKTRFNTLLDRLGTPGHGLTAD